jgi:DNA polymerase lambda
VQAIEAIVAREAMALNPFMTVQTCGSYRRGKATCGDVDIILTEKAGDFDKGFIAKLIERLEGNLLTDHLTVPKGGSHESMSYMGVGMLPEVGLHRRIDIKHYPIHQFAFAVLYFTGSDMFNRSMRLFARKKGYSLSDHALVPVEHRPGAEKWQGQEVICFTEQDIFRFLGLDYRTPEERNV